MDKEKPKPTRRFSLTVRAKKPIEESNPKLKSIFGQKQRKELDDEPKRSSSRGSLLKPDANVVGKKEKDGNWPAPGKVSFDASVPGAAAPVTDEGSNSSAPSPRGVDSESEADSSSSWPRETEFAVFESQFEKTFSEKLAENVKVLADLYRPVQSVRVTEFRNRREQQLVLPAAADEVAGSQTAAVRSIAAFYARPWLCIDLPGGSLSCSGRLPAMLAQEQPGKIEPLRDVLKKPKIPFQAEGTSRHFFLQKISLQLPSTFSAEPILVTIAAYDREMQQKLTADVTFVFPGSLKTQTLPDHLRIACDARGRRAILSVASASRDTFLVGRFHRLLRSSDSHRKAASLAGLSEEQKRLFDKDTLHRCSHPALSSFWEPFAMCFAPTLRQTSQGFVTSRGNTVRALEPLSGHVEMRDVFELANGTSTELYNLLNSSVGFFPIDASLSMDVDVEWSPALVNSYLDGIVEVADVFSSALTVANSAFNVLYIYPLKVLALPSMIPPDGLLVLRVGFKQSLAGPLLPLSYQSAALGGEATSKEFGWSLVSRAHKLSAEFHDEIRVQLPTILEPESILVLQVLRVDAHAESETAVATLNIPFFVDANRVLENGIHSVLLGINTPTHAVTKGDTLNLPVVKFFSRFVSTLYLQDGTTTQLLRQLLSKERNRAVQSVISSVPTVPRAVERFNFPIMLFGLLSTMHYSEEAAPFVAVSALMEVISMLDRLHMSFPDSSSSHHPFLLSFASHMFSPPGPKFEDSLLSVWMMVIEQLPTPGFLEKMTLSRVWVLLHLLVKSIMLSKSLGEIHAAQESLVPASLPASGVQGLRARRGTVSSPHASSDNSKELSLFASGSHSLTISSSPSHNRSPSVSHSVASASSPQMVRRAAAAPPTVAAPSESLPVSAPKPTMAELRRVSDGMQLQFKPLLGRLIAFTKQFESTESAQLSILELGGVLRSTFTCLDRGFCLDTLTFVLACMDAAGWSDWTSSLLSVVFGPGTGFVALNMPVATYTIANSSDHIKLAETNHPFIALIVSRLKKEVEEDRIGSASSCIWLLVALLASHEEDPLLKVGSEEDEDDDEDEEDDEEEEKVPVLVKKKSMEEKESEVSTCRESVVSMYFCHSLTVLDLYASGRLSFDPSVRASQPWFTSALYVWCNMAADLRHMWYFVESVSRLNQWLDLLSAGCKQCRGSPVMFPVCLGALKLLTDFCREQHDDSTRHAPYVFSLLSGLFDTATSCELDSSLGPQFVDALFECSELVASQNLAALFDQQHTPYCQMLVIPTIFLCNSPSDKLRDAAAQFLWRLIQLNDEHRGSFVQVRLACTIAISRLVTEKKAGDTYLLKKALDAVVARADSARDVLRENIAEMMNRLFSVLKSVVLLATFDHEPENKVDICFRISEGYAGSPDLRVTWLKIVASLHQTNRDASEAAQALLVVACLIAQYLSIARLLPEGFDPAPVLARICPYLQSPDFVGVARGDVDNKLTAMRLEVWTLDGLANVLFDAAQLLSDAGCLESAMDCYNLLIGLHKPLAQWLPLLKAYSGAQLACKALLKITTPPPEPKYFRVHFVGAAFDRLNGKSFVYRGDPSQRLMDFSTFLTKRCQDNASAYGAARVELLGNDIVPSKEQQEQKEVLYVQVARVYPVSPTPSGVVSEFVLDLAHSDQNKQQQLVAAQGRKKQYFTTAMPFPSFARRIEILNTRNVILSPLQNALQLMQERVAAVRDAVKSNNATVISGLLYGNLMTTISEGPEAIAEGFLAPDKATPSEETTKLAGLVADFVKLTEQALEVHESLMSNEMREWQDTAVDRFQVLKTKLNSYLQE